MLMTWKKTAAGEIIYNKCPPNATGEGRGMSTPKPPTPWSRAGGCGWHGGARHCRPYSTCRGGGSRAGNELDSPAQGPPAAGAC